MNTKFMCSSLLLIIFIFSTSAKTKCTSSYKKKCNSPPTPIYCTGIKSIFFCPNQPSCQKIAAKYAKKSPIISIDIYCHPVRFLYPDDNFKTIPSICKVKVETKGKYYYHDRIFKC